MALAAVGVAAAPAAGQGIQTHVALPVAEGEGIVRAQLRAVRASGEDAGSDRRSTTWLSPWTLAFGVTAELTAFASLPIHLHASIRSPDGRARQGFAAGNLDLLLRYTVFRVDPAPLSTRRLALLAGASLPVGADRFSPPTFDPVLGAVATWARDRSEIDADVLYTLPTRRQGFRRGPRLRYDLAWRYRLWPAHFGRGALQLGGLLELNGRVSRPSRLHGRRIAGSAGRVLFLAPGLHLASRRVILEASVQIPIHQELGSGGLETDWSAVLGLRLPVALPGP